jgi:hypothetical protein
MGEVRPDLAEMAGNLTVSGPSATSAYKIDSMDVNCPASMQKVGRKNLDLF